MWDFPRYTSRKWAFSFSWDTSETTGASAGVEAGASAGTEAGARAGVEAGARARAEAGAQASTTALKILYKSSSEYLGTLIAITRASAMRNFVSKDPAGWLNNLSSDLEHEEESGGATEGATEGITEGYSRHGRLRPQTEVILELISSKNTLPNKLANALGMEKLEL